MEQDPVKACRQWSAPYAPAALHNFMHNKLVAVDGELVATNSFNFSPNATHNAAPQRGKAADHAGADERP